MASDQFLIEVDDNVNRLSLSAAALQRERNTFWWLDKVPKTIRFGSENPKKEYYNSVQIYPSVMQTTHFYPVKAISYKTSNNPHLESQ